MCVRSTRWYTRYFIGSQHVGQQYKSVLLFARRIRFESLCFIVTFAGRQRKFRQPTFFSEVTEALIVGVQIAGEDLSAAGLAHCGYIFWAFWQALVYRRLYLHGGAAVSIQQVAEVNRFGSAAYWVWTKLYRSAIEATDWVEHTVVGSPGSRAMAAIYFHGEAEGIIFWISSTFVVHFYIHHRCFDGASLGTLIRYTYQQERVTSGILSIAKLEAHLAIGNAVWAKFHHLSVVTDAALVVFSFPAFAASIFTRNNHFKGEGIVTWVVSCAVAAALRVLDLGYNFTLGH